MKTCQGIDVLAVCFTFFMKCNIIRGIVESNNKFIPNQDLKLLG